MAELRGGLRSFHVFLICLALGVAAIAAIGTIRISLERGLSENGAALLGGDGEVSLTYRFATPEERAVLEAESRRVSEIADFRSMAVAGDRRVLTQVKAVDGAYPLTGEVKLAPAMPLGAALEPREGLYGAVLAPQLIARLGLEIGDSFRLGDARYRLRAALTREPDSLGVGISIGPRTLLLREALEGAGLLAPGTLFNSFYRLDLPEAADPDAVRARLESALPESGLSWRDARNAAPQAAEFIDRIGAFLVLIGFSGLAMGGIGVSLAVQAYLARKTPVIATLRSIGAPARVILTSYGAQIAALALLGTGLGLVLGGLLPLLLGPWLAAQLPVPAEFGLYGAPLVEAGLYGLLTALIFTAWPLARSENVRAGALFRESAESGDGLPRWPWLAVILAATAALIALAAWFSGNLQLTLYTAGALAAVMLALAVTAQLIRAGARRLHRRASLPPMRRLALAAIGGARSDALTTVLSLGLGLSVLSFVGQVDGNLQRSIQGELPDVAPSFFFIDIQKNQLSGFEESLRTQDSVSRIETAPMLRGIISEINGRPAAEVAGDHWVLEGDRGITYYDALPENWTLTAGENWPEGADGPPQLSFAAEEAEEMGLKLGDNVTVNVLGRAITAEITGFREVDFSTAGIGFVMAMNPGAIAAAPHSLIATVYADPEAEARILSDISARYPNITAIPVSEAIARVAEVFAALAGATRWGAAAAILAGVVVLIGAAGTGAAQRARETAILKTLGATRRRILTSFLWRAGLLGAAAGLIALAAGIAAAWAVSRFLFEADFAVIWPSALIILACGTLANLAANLAFSLRALGARPAQVLRAEG
ncbi:drug:proton antiporter [Rhodobacteraceae bacterium 63075]|nr:drug:proton antiporter [Rhodobacteraceae bacterium 63075]